MRGAIAAAATRTSSTTPQSSTWGLFSDLDSQVSLETLDARSTWKTLRGSIRDPKHPRRYERSRHLSGSVVSAAGSILAPPTPPTQPSIHFFLRHVCHHFPLMPLQLPKTVIGDALRPFRDTRHPRRFGHNEVRSSDRCQSPQIQIGLGTWSFRFPLRRPSAFRNTLSIRGTVHTLGD